MRFIAISALLLCDVTLAPHAWSAPLNVGPTAQNITLTGLGGNASGEGQVRITWGSCVFSNNITTCTVSGPYTGLGGSGTISTVLTYSGNGPSPLTGTSISPGSDTISASLSSGSILTTITESTGKVLNFYSGFLPSLVYNPANDSCTGVPSSACTVGQVGLMAGATITGPGTGTYDTTPIIRSSLGVISASAYGGFTSIAPGTWIEIYGTNLATVLPYTWTGSDFAGVNAPNALMGTTVTVGGQQAFIDYVSPSQVNAQVPSNIGTGMLQPVVVTTGGGSSLPYPVQVNAVQPGMLAPSVFQVNGQQYIVALFPDGVTYVLPPGITTAVPTRRAKPGDTILLYGIGFGNVTPNIPAGQIAEQNTALPSFQISFSGVSAKVSYAGLTPGLVGLYQFNVIVPAVTFSDTVPVTFSDGTTAGTQTMVIAIGN